MPGVPEDLVGPAAVVAGTALVVAGMVGLGTIPCRLLSKATGPLGVLTLPYCLIAGWAMAAIASATLAPWGAHQTLLSWALMLGGLLALATRRSGVERSLVMALALGLPLASMTTTMPAVMFDEFSHWLPNTRYLIEHDAYWLAGDWAGVSDKPGYPNGTTVVALLVSRLAGAPATETAFKTFMVFCIVIFGWLLAGARSGPKAPISIVVGLALVALIDPFFDPRITLTSYADGPTGIVLAATGLAAAAGLSRATRGDNAAANAWFAWTGIAAAALMMLRPTNLVVLAGVLAGILIFLAKSRKPVLIPLGLAAGPPALGLGIWQTYLRSGGIGPDNEARSLASWDWAAPAVVLRSLFVDRLSNNPGTAVAACVLLALAGMGLVLMWRRRPAVPSGVADLGLLFPMVGIVSGCFIAFLAWAYVAVFSADEVGRAGSAWRFISELGPLLTVAVVAAVPQWPFGTNKAAAAVAAGGAGLCILLSPLWGRAYYGVACRYVDVLAARKIVADLKRPLLNLAVATNRPHLVAFAHPTMGNWLAIMAAYDLGWRLVPGSITFRMGESTPTGTEQWAWDAGAGALLDLTLLDRQAIAASSTIPAVALRVRPTDRSQPWTVVEELAPQRLPPPCGRR